MFEIIIDTSVLAHILLTTRHRQADAKELGHYLIENGVRMRVPMHAFFELASALKNEEVFSSSLKAASLA